MISKRADPSMGQTHLDGVRLSRAERAGERAAGLTAAAIKTGRTYTATYRVTDKSGNTALVSGKVTVPYSQ